MPSARPSAAGPLEVRRRPTSTSSAARARARRSGRRPSRGPAPDAARSLGSACAARARRRTARCGVVERGRRSRRAGARCASPAGSGPADRVVAADEVGELLVGRWPAPADVGVVRRRSSSRVARRAVRHQHHADLARPRRSRAALSLGREVTSSLTRWLWTKSTTAASTSGSVPGCTPWPRLKTCRDGRRCRPARRRCRSSASVAAGEHERRVEVALDRRDPVAEPRAGVGDRRAPVEPDHAAARRRPSTRAGGRSRCRSGCPARSGWRAASSANTRREWGRTKRS